MIFTYGLFISEMANIIFIVISLFIIYIPSSRQTPQEDASRYNITYVIKCYMYM